MYLHSAYYQKNESVLKTLNVKPKEYVIVRYIAYDAHHDLAACPLPEGAKKIIVSEIAKRYRVFVSLESGVYDTFYNDYQLKISPEQMHNVLANAKFMVTEGATMASEAFVLGVPYIYLNPLKCGNINYQCNNYPERAFQTTDSSEALGIVERLLRTDMDTEAEQKEVESLTINPTDFLEWFVEHFPDSKCSDYWPTQ